MSKGRKFSILGIVFAICSLIVLPIVFGPLAIIFGTIGVLKGDTNLNNNVIKSSIIAAVPAQQTTPQTQVETTPPDLKLLPSSRAEFNDASVKSTRKNTIQLFVDFVVTGKLLEKVPLFVQAGDKTTKLEMNTEESTKQTIKTIDVDRNKFPTEIYIRADIDDADKTNNALFIPVVVKKDGKEYVFG